MFGALAGVALAFPFFWMVGTREWIWIAVAFILARAVVTAAMFGPQAAYFAELFRRNAARGFAFARELGSILAGGPAPFVATALVAWSGTWWRWRASGRCFPCSPRSRSCAVPRNL